MKNTRCKYCRATSVVLIALLLLTANSAKGQFRNIIDRMYTVVGVGPNCYWNDDLKPLKYVGFQGEAGIGMNLFGGVGGRLSAVYLNNSNIEAVQSNYMSFHLDLTFDLLQMMVPTYNVREQQFMFTAGLGYTLRQENYLEGADNEATLALGFNYIRPLGNKIYLLGELTSYLYVPCFDFNNKPSAITMATLGIQYRFNDNPYRNGLMDGGTQMYENWFISIAGGINSLSYNGILMKDRLRLMRPAAEIMIGKYLTPIVGVRFGCNGLKAGTDAMPGFKMANVHLDMLLNLSNMKQVRPGRDISCYLYGGGGMLNRMDSHTVTFEGHAGMMMRFWISRWSDVIADARYELTTPGFAHDQPGQHGLSVGMFTLTLGYVLNITSGSMR